MSRKVLVRQGVPLTLRHSKGEWNTLFNGLLKRVDGTDARREQRRKVRRSVSRDRLIRSPITHITSVFIYTSPAPAGSFLELGEQSQAGSSSKGIMRRGTAPSDQELAPLPITASPRQPQWWVGVREAD